MAAWPSTPAIITTACLHLGKGAPPPPYTHEEGFWISSRTGYLPTARSVPTTFLTTRIRRPACAYHSLPAFLPPLFSSPPSPATHAPAARTHTHGLVTLVGYGPAHRPSLCLQTMPATSLPPGFPRHFYYTYLGLLDTPPQVDILVLYSSFYKLIQCDIQSVFLSLCVGTHTHFGGDGQCGREAWKRCMDVLAHYPQLISLLSLTLQTTHLVEFGHACGPRPAHSAPPLCAPHAPHSRRSRQQAWLYRTSVSMALL